MEIIGGFVTLAILLAMDFRKHKSEKEMEFNRSGANHFITLKQFERRVRK